MKIRNRFLIEDLLVGESLRVIATYVGPGYTKIQGKEYIVDEDLKDFPLGNYIQDLKEDGETAIKAFEIINTKELETKEKWAYGRMIMELKRIV